MNVTDPIRRVSVVSTGQVQIRPDHLLDVAAGAPAGPAAADHGR